METKQQVDEALRQMICFHKQYTILRKLTERERPNMYIAVSYIHMYYVLVVILSSGLYTT